jgi:hypothetical protein
MSGYQSPTPKRDRRHYKWKGREVGLAKNREQEKKANRGRRGSTNNKARLEAFDSERGGADADWGGCNSEILQGVVVKITELGGAVTIGLSRDMGAHSMTLLLDGTRKTLWFNGSEDLDAALLGVAATLDGMS